MSLLLMLKIIESVKLSRIMYSYVKITYKSMLYNRIHIYVNSYILV